METECADVEPLREESEKLTSLSLVPSRFAETGHGFLRRRGRMPALRIAPQSRIETFCVSASAANALHATGVSNRLEGGGGDVRLVSDLGNTLSLTGDGSPEEYSTVQAVHTNDF
eukprot:6763794-Pyramimonas_sp.AAC.1